MVLETASPTNGTNIHIPSNGERMPAGERRRRPRAALHWAILITSKGAGHPIASTIKNISSQGFYCLVQESFQAGEYLECAVLIPAQNSADSEDLLCLQCRARVLRVDPATADGACGIACQIEDYSVVYKNRTQASLGERCYVMDQLEGPS